MTTHTITINHNTIAALAAMIHTTDHTARASATLHGIYVRILSRQEGDDSPRLRMVSTDGKMLVERTIPIVGDSWLTEPSTGPFDGEALDLHEVNHPDCAMLENGVIFPPEFCKDAAKVAKKPGNYLLRLSNDRGDRVELVDSVHGEPLTKQYKLIGGCYPKYASALNWEAPAKNKFAPVYAFTPYYLSCIAQALGLRFKETARQAPARLALIPNSSGRGWPVYQVQDAKSAVDLMQDVWSESAPYRALLMAVSIPN